jgi:hypothetical protein
MIVKTYHDGKLYPISLSVEVLESIVDREGKFICTSVYSSENKK